MGRQIEKPLTLKHGRENVYSSAICRLQIHLIGEGQERARLKADSISEFRMGWNMG